MLGMRCGCDEKGSWTVKFKVMLFDYDGAHRPESVTLPFVPFIGLQLQCRFAKGDFLKIEDVFWNADRERFECYMEDKAE